MSPDINRNPETAPKGEPDSGWPRLDFAALAAQIAESERIMGVPPILGRTRMRPGY